ncbi:MAG: CehA/McbA family metallohydrolase [Myxococcales bacterium]|nr:CehA/McbA family metallohydrolase [Myxococcales bacterium]
MQRCLTTALAVVVLFGFGCDDPDLTVAESVDAFVPRPDGPRADAAPDVAIADADPDLAVDAAPGPDAAPRPAPGTPVELALDDLMAPPPDAMGRARAFVSERPEDLVGGPTPLSRVGDYVLENEKVRFVVEAGDRVIGPCPYGGNVIDADIRRPAGEPGEDVVGELCLFINLGQTLDPERFDILNDGADGRAAVLAVTGHPTPLDFVNLRGILAAFPQGRGVVLGYDIDVELPLTITQYYVLRPGDTGVRVATAMRNDGDTAVHLPVGHLIDSGGAVAVFNPLGPSGGYGSGNPFADITGVPLPGVAYVGERAGHAYVPVPAPALEGDFPTSGAFVTISGVSVSLIGSRNLLPVLLATPPQLPTLNGLFHLAPGDIGRVDHWHFVGDGDAASLIDPMWAVLGVPTTPVTGLVTTAGVPTPGVRVAAVDDEGRALNQGRTGADGRYTMRVPSGRHYTLVPWREGSPPAAGDPAIDVADQPVEAPAIELQATARLRVRITRPDGAPTPGRLTVRCDGACAQVPQPVQRDVTSDGPLGQIASVIFTGVDGLADVDLAPGTYQLTVSRGPEWSVWPPDALTTGGEPLEVAAGDAPEVTAEIARVVDTAGVLTGDFHVHAINSPDSPVTLADRVRSFLGEGVDVLVSTDHDVITDYGPTIAELGGEQELIGVPGVELTTFDYGHYNSFPLPRDPESRNGGAVDWAGGRGFGLRPAEIFAALQAFPGTQVVQVNHADNGFFQLVQADLMTGVTLTDPSVLRLPPVTPDPVTGDTGLWDEGFTAMEVMNGHGVGNFWGRLRWWLTLVGRGFTPTGTGVSDTHKRLTAQAGGPRTYVFVGEAHDTPATFEREHFARMVNAGRAIGSNGPFFTVTAQVGEQRASIGDTLAIAPGTPVDFTVDIQTPAWMRIETVGVYSNIVEPLVSDSAEYIEDALPPTLEAPLEALPDEIAAEGTVPHSRHRWRARFQLAPEKDSYVVVVVRGGTDLYPVVLRRGVRPLSFSNPLYLDVDGDGYDHPPITPGMAKRRPPLPPAVPRPIALPDLHRMLQAGHPEP